MGQLRGVGLGYCYGVTGGLVIPADATSRFSSERGRFTSRAARYTRGPLP